MATANSVTTSIGMLMRKETKRGEKRSVTFQGIPNHSQDSGWLAVALPLGVIEEQPALCDPRILWLRRTTGISN